MWESDGAVHSRGYLLLSLIPGWCPGLDRAAIGMSAQAYRNPILLVMRKNLHDIPNCHGDQPGGQTVPCVLAPEPFTEPLTACTPCFPLRN